MKILKSETVMGLWNFSAASFHDKLSPREGKNLIKIAYRAGIRCFDTAFSYQEASSCLYSALKELGKDDVCIISKVMPVPTIRKKVETELRRLGRDYLDVLLLHWPTAEPQLSESLEELSKIKEEGKAKSIGVSNFPLPLLIWCKDRFPIEYHERPLSLIWSKDWEEEKLLGLKTIAYSPLGMGLLSGKYEKADEIQDRRRTLPMLSSQIFQEILNEVYKKPEIALSWVYEEEPWAVVSGFSSPEQPQLLNKIEHIDTELKKKLTRLADEISKETNEDNIFAHRWM